jgi:redox-sensing transcriptional repressor
MFQAIPDIVVARLPVYLRALAHMAGQGKSTTSSLELGKALGISSAQIRKDLSHFGEFGKQGTGYNISYLTNQLRQILNLEHEWRVAIVGAGYLGHALASYQGFQQRGFRMMWLFDCDQERIGKRIGDIQVQAMDQLAQTALNEGIDMAIIAVPAAAAQEVADTLVACGVRAILNYAPITLTVPPQIQIQNSDPVVQMQHMAYYLAPRPVAGG